MKKLFILNWKMYLSHLEGLTWLNRYGHHLDKLTQKASLVICPPLTLLGVVSPSSKNILWGAQDCSEHKEGAFTGDCSARSLKEAGARFCIVGHSERRTNHGETESTTIKKASQLITTGLTPIICLGSSVYNELPFLLEKIKELNPPSLIIAYEPESAIGSDQLPPSDEIEEVCSAIKNTMAKLLTSSRTHVLYGGSVNSVSIKNLLNLSSLDGFLLGRSSTDFQELEKIVGLT